MSIGKIVGNLSTRLVQTAAKTGAKNLKIAPTITRKMCGVPVTTNLITGTQVAKLADGTKSIVLGAGNRLSKVLGEGTSICSYPKGSFFGGANGLIAVHGKNGKAPLAFQPKEFGDFVKMMRDLTKLNV